jgi:hypothetical protein
MVRCGSTPYEFLMPEQTTQKGSSKMVGPPPLREGGQRPTSRILFRSLD